MKFMPVQYESRIPPFNINFNNGHNKRNYKKLFSRLYQESFLPQAILHSNSPDIINGTRIPKVLDLGCGFAPMAHSMLLLEKACLPLSKEKIPGIVYVGIDIREDAIRWLQNAYKADKSYYFHLHKATKDADYIGAFRPNRQNFAKTHANSDGSECLFNINLDFKADIQWSSSLFTHLTHNAALESLKFIYSSIEPTGVCINSWLIADSSSCLAMETGIADRACTYDFGSYLSYSNENPLVCTVYKLEAIKNLYQVAGLKIQNILRGSWRGGENRNIFNHYQDIIIARKDAS